MVSYTEWTAIAFDVARPDVSQQTVISRAADVWNANKTDLKAASTSEARELGRRLL